jgi:hypothetical protein
MSDACQASTALAALVENFDPVAHAAAVQAYVVADAVATAALQAMIRIPRAAFEDMVAAAPVVTTPRMPIPLFAEVKAQQRRAAAIRTSLLRNEIVTWVGSLLHNMYQEGKYDAMSARMPVTRAVTANYLKASFDATKDVLTITEHISSPMEHVIFGDMVEALLVPLRESGYMTDVTRFKEFKIYLNADVPLVANGP